MLDDGKAKAGAAGSAGMGFVYPVEAFKYMRQGFTGNTDAVIGYFQYCFIMFAARLDFDIAAGQVVADSVVHEVVYDFIDESAVGIDPYAFNVKFQLYLMFPGFCGNSFRRFIDQVLEVECIDIDNIAFIQL